MNSRKSQRIGSVLIFSLVSICMSAGGCGTIRDMNRRTQLEAVAKDWCYTIRASQVIPVYPLTEDLQVGDVFLVHQHAEDQHKEYKKKGFLPMEQLLVRLHPEGYHRFYLESHGTRGRDDIPHHWKFPSGTFGSAKEGDDPPKKITTTPSDNPPNNTTEGDDTPKKVTTPPSDNPPNKWYFGPIAAFPSYGFDIEQGQAFSLSIPVKGVPVAMSLLGAQAAKCSLTIKDAHTYGIDTLQIERQVRDWAVDNRDFLRSFSPKKAHKWCIFTTKPKEQYYVRIITRVYVAREFDVSVSTADSAGLGLTAGLKMPADMAQPSADDEGRYDTSKIYTDTLNAINSNLNAAPTNTTGKGAVERDAAGKVTGVNFGASLRVVAASSRHVSLVEKLARPTAIGYLAIDLPIMKAGVLGRRVSTLGLLETGQEPIPADHLGPQSHLTAKVAYDICRWLRGGQDPAAEKLAKGMGQFAAEIAIPDDLHFYTIVGDTADVNEPLNALYRTKLKAHEQAKRFERFQFYSTCLDQSIKALSFGGSPDHAAVLVKQTEIYEELLQRLRSSAAVKDAHRYYMARIDR